MSEERSKQIASLERAVLEGDGVLGVRLEHLQPEP